MTEKTCKDLEKKIKDLLANTAKNLSEIGKETKKSMSYVRILQDRLIEQGGLDEKYRRLARGVIQYQKDKSVDMLKQTGYSLEKIGREIGLSGGMIHKIQNDAINKGTLDEKFKRVLGGTIRYQKDEARDFLEFTKYNLEEIGEMVGLSPSTIWNIQKEAIKEGVLDEKHKRVSFGRKGIVRADAQYKKDIVIGLLRHTDETISEIGKEIGLNSTTIRKIQYKAISQGILDEKCKRTAKVPNGYYDDSEIKINKIKELVKKLDKKITDITAKDFLSNNLSGLLSNNYKNSPYLALKDAGLADFEPWEMAGGVKNNYWKDKNEGIIAVKWLLEKTGKNFEDLNAKDFRQNNLGGLLKHYNNSPSLVLKKAGYTIKKRPSKGELQKKYDELGSTAKVGEFYGKSQATVWDWMNKAGIEMQLERPSKRELQKKLKKLGSVARVSEIYKKSSTTILNWMKDYEIERKKSAMQICKEKKPSKEELESKCKEFGYTITKVADYYKVGDSTMGRWIKSYGIEVKKSDDAIKQILDNMLNDYNKGARK